jgi:hypothetical protein
VTTVLATDWWARALTLAERRTLPDPPEGRRSDSPARERLALWRAESGQFDRRLAELELEESDLAALLIEDPARLASRAAKPRWAHLVERLTKTAAPDDAGVVHPFVQVAGARLDGALDEADAAGFVDARRLRAASTGQVGARLTPLAARVSGIGPGALLDGHPVLARLLAEATEQTVEAWRELLARLGADRALIIDAVLGGTDPGRLVDARFTGDRHAGGRSDAVLTFASGARVTYRPRSTAAEVHLNELLSWLGTSTVCAIDRGHYGWVEFARQPTRVGALLQPSFPGAARADPPLSWMAAYLTDRAAFLEVLGGFAGDEIAVALRDRELYLRLLSQSIEPEVLTDALDRDRVFDQLWARSALDPLRERLIPFEVADMWAGDVPLFTTRPGNTDLMTSGGLVLPEALDIAALDRLTRRLQELCR